MQVSATPRSSLRFGPFTVDLVSHELRDNGRKVTLQEKPFQVLVALLEHPGQLVTREELRQRLWPADTFVDFEHSINTGIKKVREALHDSGGCPKFIETLPRRGYRFIAAVEDDRNAQPLMPGAAQIATTKGHALEQTHRKLRQEFFGVSAKIVARKGTILIVALVIVVAAIVELWTRISQMTSATAPVVSSIAVLPFVDLSPNHDHEYFSEGLAEEILNHLTKIPNLRVAGRASAFQFRGKNEDSHIVGQKLDVAEILEGSVQQEQDRIRVTARLVRAEDGLDLWSDSFDRQLKDIFAVEDDIAQAVASALQVKLLATRSPEGVGKSTAISPEGYEAFLHARYFEHMQDEASAKKALQYANKVIDSDPNFAPAYALRADVRLRAAGMTWLDLSSVSDAVRRDTEKAIALDPNLADGYRVLGQIYSWIESNCQAAETPMKRALDLAPGDPDNLDQAAMLAMCLGQPNRAVELWKQELLLDPLRPDEYLWLAQGLRDLGRYDESHVALSKALDLNPNHVSMIHEINGEVYLAEGRPQDALNEVQKEPPGFSRDLGLALAYSALGQRPESDAALSRIRSEHSSDAAYQIAQVHGYRGETDQAFDWLNRAYAQHDPGLMWFKTDPKLKSLHNDSRYAAMLRKLNLPE